MPAAGQVRQHEVSRGRRDGHEVVHGGAVGDGGGRGIRVRVDDFVAALLALADDGGDAAEDAFALGGRGVARLGVAVEDLGVDCEALLLL